MNILISKKIYIGLLCSAAIVSPVCAGSKKDMKLKNGWSAVNPPVVKTVAGELRGFINDGTFTFEGIQYAIAKRFEMPQEVPSWNGIKNAQSYGTICPVPEQTAVGVDEFCWPHRYWPQNENCQFLNIWTQHIDKSAGKPVVVFIHGGGYTNGSSIEGVAYDGTNLSKFGDVVVVTLNHRLNALGYLDLSDYGDAYKYSGDLGQADIVAALQWVQKNIADFGGDPSNVTVFGQSGGGGKINTLMRMESAKGLFCKAVIMSGMWGENGYSAIDQTTAKAATKGIMEKLGVTTVEGLKNVSYHDLITAATETGTTWWAPVYNGYVGENYCDWAKKIPVIVGNVFSEFNTNLYTGDLDKNSWTDEKTAAKMKARFGASSKAVADEFAKLFPGNKPQDAVFYGASFIQGSYAGLNYLKKVSEAPVYEYIFDYELPVNGGVTPLHCIDLSFLFHNIDIPAIRIGTGANKETYKVENDISRAFVNFAYTGDPSRKGLAWKPFTTANNECMIFGTDSHMADLKQAELLKLMNGK